MKATPGSGKRSGMAWGGEAIVTYINGLPYTATMLERRAARLAAKVAIIGSRDYPDLDAVRAYVRSLPANTIIVSGGAKGVDTTAEQTALECGLETLIFPAEWDKYGKSAGYRRNADIVNAADRVVAFWDGSSKGTAHSVELARKAGKDVLIVEGSAK